MSNFYGDRDSRGIPAELMTVEWFHAKKIHATVNPAPESDRAGRASHDIVVAGELWDVKSDYIAAWTQRIFVERDALEHTNASRFCYWIISPYGYDVRVFLVEHLINLFNAKQQVPRGDGTFYERHLHEHGIAGDQRDNDGVFLPMEVVKQVGLPLYQVANELTKQAA
jgi:hypothetical protein